MMNARLEEQRHQIAALAEDDRNKRLAAEAAIAAREQALALELAKLDGLNARNADMEAELSALKQDLASDLEPEDDA